MFSVFKIVIFLVEKTIGESPKLFSEAEIIFFASVKSFSMTQKIVSEAPTAFGLTQNPAFSCSDGRAKDRFLSGHSSDSRNRIYSKETRNRKVL
jgi:hypothetical protein